MEDIIALLRVSSSNIPVALSLLRLLRVLRLIRILRVVRLLRYMAELRTIVVSMSSCLKPLVSTMVLLALVMYVVGVYFTQMTLTYRIDHRDSDAAKELLGYALSESTASSARRNSWGGRATPCLGRLRLADFRRPPQLSHGGRWRVAAGGGRSRLAGRPR